MWWFLLMLSMTIATIAGIVYLSKRIAKFNIVQTKIKNRKYQLALGIGINLFFAVLLTLLIGPWNLMVCFIHVVVIWLICDGIAALWHKKYPKKSNVYIAGLVAIAVSVIYLSMGYYDASHRGYGEKELVEQLVANHVIVLEDETVNLTENYYLCGRLDMSRSVRADMAELMRDIPSDGYVIVLDHEPRDYNAQAEAGADLVLSGHTHGGQLLPVNQVGKWLGLNERIYGYERRMATDFIVSSGISDWVFKFKTGCISEIFVIDVSGR